MVTRQDVLTCLHLALASQADDFREGQWEAIDQLVNRRGRMQGDEIDLLLEKLH